MTWDLNKIKSEPIFVNHRTQERRDYESLKRYIWNLGLDHRLTAYAPDFTMVNPLMERNRGRYLDMVKKALDLCAEMGSPSMRVDSIAAPGSIPDIEFEPGFAFNKPSEVVDIVRGGGVPAAAGYGDADGWSG